MDKIRVLNDSRMARIVYDSFGQYLKNHKSSLLSRLLAATKTGPVDPQIYAKFLGGIEALDELDSIIKKNVLKGEKVEKELLDAARNQE